jgi:hypothetical protein
LRGSGGRVLSLRN